MSFEIQLPELATLLADKRLSRFITIETRLRRVASDVARFNPRTLDNLGILQDLQWTVLTAELLYATGDEAKDLKLTEDPKGDVATANLLRRLAAVQPDILLHPPLQSELAGAEMPKAVVWSFNGEPLSNPYLPELDSLTDSVMDRKYLEEFQPELAKLLQKESEGGPSYREHFESIERDEQLKKTRAFKGTNPFVAGTSTSEPNLDTIERTKLIVELNRTNKTLARELERESKLPGCNPFARRARNMTKEMIFRQADERLAALLEASADFEQVQLSAELAAADEALKKAALAASQNQREQNMARRGR